MVNNLRIYRQQGSSYPLMKILLAVVLLVGISLSLAWVWHTTQQKSIAPPSQNQNNPSGLLESVSSTTASPSASEPEAAPPEKPPEQTPASLSGAVPASEPVENTYFDDAIFFGDSISTGISLYHIADNTAVVAMTGINPDNINYKEVIDADDGSDRRLTVLDAAKAHGARKKVYIMLGGNGIGYDIKTFITGYRTFLTSVKAQYPDAVIYLQSMTPVVADYVNEFDPTMNNEKIDTYNLEICKLAQEEGVYYLDVASAFKDETGALPKEASPVDGLHFTPEYYAKWFAYLKKHTVEESE